jgi:hypothetical protein
MIGGGAERVAALLANEMHAKGTDVRFLLTRTTPEELVRCDLSDEVPLIHFSEQIARQSVCGRAASRVSQILANVLCKTFELFRAEVPARFA